MHIWQSQVQERILQLNQQMVNTVFLQLGLLSPDGPPSTEAMVFGETFTEGNTNYENLITVVHMHILTLVEELQMIVGFH